MTGPANPNQPQPWEGGQPQFGQPAGPQGAPPKKSNGVLIGLIAAVAAAVIAIGGFLLFKGDDSDKDSKGGGGTVTQSAEPDTDDSDDSDSDDSDSDDSDSDEGEFNADGATDIARQYLDDVNAEDPDHARTLLCNRQKASFDKNIQTESSDFSVEFTTITHVSTEKVGDQYNVVFDLEGNSRDDKASTFELTIEFGVIDEDGPKICAENVI